MDARANAGNTAYHSKNTIEETPRGNTCNTEYSSTNTHLKQ